MTSALTFVLSIPAILLAVASVVGLRRLPLPAARLTGDERALCSAIVARGEGRAWACPRALRTGTCVCVPCARLVREKERVPAAADIDTPMRAA